MAWTRSVIVTGGTLNFGYHTALEIAKTRPDYLVVISSRSDKADAAASINKALGQDNTVFVPLDLADLARVRNLAEQWAASARPPIQSLVLNAGLQFPGALTETPAGIEFTFAVKHVGHALLFHLLCPHLADKARIVLTSSGTHDPAQKSGMPDAVYTSAEDLAHPPPSVVDTPGRQRYTSSKLANVLWTYTLSRRLADRGMTVTAMDPGLMPGTGLVREAGPILKFAWLRVLPKLIPLLRRVLSPNIHTAAESGVALARLAISDDIDGVTGKYVEGLKETQSSKDSHDKDKQEDMWRWTVNYLAQGPEELASFLLSRYGQPWMGISNSECFTRRVKATRDLANSHRHLIVHTKLSEASADEPGIH